MIAPAPMIHLRSVTKRFGGVVAVDDVSLQVRTGEFLTLLGPSGCGKTTLLRLVAGFDSPDAGEVHIGGADVTHVPPYRRNVNQVFQSYALFPHLSVHDNVAFGLRMQRVPRAEITRRVEEALAQVELGGLGERRPHQLSGGQRQRVALARALVPQPQVLLLDEPLSALDAKLRRAMQTELKQLQRRVGLTFVFVTHDQEEALTMSDRIAVLNRGRIEQLGTADEIYAKPRTAFVADFIGEANLLEAELVAAAVPAAPADAAAGGGACGSVRLAGGLELAMTLRDWPESTQRALVSIRPEKVLVSKARPEAENVFRARVAEEVFRGAMDELVLETDAGTRLRAVVANESALLEAIHEGDQVWCGLHADDLVVVKAE